MKIELSEIKRITDRSEQINSELTGQLNQMTSTLQEIITNLISKPLEGPNTTLIEEINKTANAIPGNLEKITTFLRTQIQSYEATNVNAKEQIDSLVSSVNSSFTK